MASIKAEAVTFKRIGFSALAVALVLHSFNSTALAATDEIEVYKVGKKVSDYQATDDFSSPEAAYATINRKSADGDGDWRDVSTAKLAERLSSKQAIMTAKPKDIADEFRNATILEVRIFRGTYAQVTAQMKRGLDLRSFELEDGRWLNHGNDVVKTAEDAAEKFSKLVSRRMAVPHRSPVENPEAVLKSHLEYLQKNGVSPKEFILKTLAQHKLVALGEIHHRPLYWELNSEVVRDPRFAKEVGTIYLELPSHAQDLVDQFLAAKELNTEPVMEMLRDNLWTGWPDKAMLDFFVAVWQTNQTLDDSQRIRVVLVDMPRPWKKRIRDGGFEKHRTDRDKLMADNILRDMNASSDTRHAFFIVGYAHIENLTYAADKSPIRNAGVYLRQELGNDMYSIVQHGPVIKNMGGVLGRTCLGLFDQAFAANDHKPIAIELAKGPFGQHRFDMDGDRCEITSGLFSETFDGYIYLGPLEDEIFSPLISGFYTDEFVQELDQRHRLMRGHGLMESLGLTACDGKSFEAWMSNSWGKPRKWKHFLGPVTAWKDGDDWEKCDRERQYRKALEHPELITAEAEELFAALRSINSKEGQFPGFKYQAHHYYDVWIRWVTKRFSESPIKTVELGRVHADAKGRPAIPYTLLLEDGKKLEGVLPFEYEPRGNVWFGCQGLDWHLQSESN